MKKNNQIALSHYGEESAVSSPVNSMMTSFSHDFREKIDINLGVGYVNEKTIPRNAIEKAFSHIIHNQKKYPFSLNYGNASGSPHLKKAIEKMISQSLTRQDANKIFQKNKIVIGANGATSILEGISDILKPGIIVTSDPVYYIYSHLLERKGFTILPIPEDQEGISLTNLKKQVSKINPKAIRAFYLVSIGNPTGTILTQTRRLDFLDYLTELNKKQKNKIPLFLDKAYEDLIHHPQTKPPSPLLLHDQHELVYEIGTVSKILAPALRIGYIIGPPGPLLNGLIQKNSDTGFSASLILQETVALLLKNISPQIKKVHQGYHQKAKIIQKWIDDLFSQELENQTGGKAGFYFYLTFKNTQTHPNSLFFQYTSRTTGDSHVDYHKKQKSPRVLYIPGSYCVHPKGSLKETGKRQLRISYGFEELKNIEKGLHIMKEAMSYAKNKQ